MAAAAPKSVQDALREELTCSICLELFSDPVLIVGCGHNFCRLCLARYWGGALRDVSCPQCRAAFPGARLEENRQLKNVAQVARRMASLGPKETPKETPQENPQGPLCALHQEPLQLFCQDDGSPICVACHKGKAHRQHRVLPLQEAHQELQEEIADRLTYLKETREDAEKFKEGAKQSIKDMEQKIGIVKDKLLADVEEFCQFLKCQVQFLPPHLDVFQADLADKMDRTNRRYCMEIDQLNSLIIDMEKTCKRPEIELLKERAQLQIMIHKGEVMCHRMRKENDSTENNYCCPGPFELKVPDRLEQRHRDFIYHKETMQNILKRFKGEMAPVLRSMRDYVLKPYAKAGMENLYSAKHPNGGTVCSICLQPCQHLTMQPCGHHFCQVCSSQSWEKELKGKIVCFVCQDFFLKKKPGSKEPLGKGNVGSMVVDETKQVDPSLCEIHKEELNLFCVEDQVLLCTVCRKSWDHMAHNVIPRNQEAKAENQGTGSPYRGWGDEFSNAEANSPAVVGYTNDTVAFQGKELLGGNQKDDPEKVKLFDLDLEEKQEEGNHSNSSGQNSITWIVLVLFLIQIAGLVTTIFVFTKAKADLPASAALSGSAPCCPPDWIMNLGNCYHSLELEGTWEAGRHHCSSLGASLAAFGNLEKLNEAMTDKSPYNHWIGLLREPEESWKWTDGTPFNNLFEINGDGQCAYLTHGTVSSADCSVKKKSLCSQSVKINHGHCRGT